MTFVEWLTAQEGQDPVGQLAARVRQDDHFPAEWGLEEMAHHMEWHRADPEWEAVLRVAWAEWRGEMEMAA